MAPAPKPNRKQETMTKPKFNRDELIPTPHVGWRVQWREEGRRHLRPADVIATDIHSPGVVTLSVNMGQRLQVIEVVTYDKLVDEARRGTPDIKRRGTWQYMPDELVPDSHFDLHMDSIERREESRKHQEAHIRQIQKEAAEAAKRPVDPVALQVAQAQAAAVLGQQQ